jgi:hypothetical protein
MSCTICPTFKTSFPSPIGPHGHKTDACALKSMLLCRRCHTRGHLTTACTEDWSHWERPTCMEELIPQHIKLRYGITTKTPITFDYPRTISHSPENAYEFHPINHIVIPKSYDDVKAMVKRFNIKVPGNTKPSQEACVQAIQDWAKATGRIIVSPKNKNA